MESLDTQADFGTFPASRGWIVSVMQLEDRQAQVYTIVAAWMI
jgi:hypothetical protein